jgi:beta-glucosidase
MKRTDFPKDFLWGTATASFQVEGSPDGDGRGKSIWDTFCETPGKVENGDTGKIACDHYNLYKEDVALMSELGVNAYRFSIAWPRLLPNGAGQVNQKGIDFYNKLIDALLEKNITPAATLYHWDLPQALHDKGGWVNRDIVEWFRDYAELAFRSYGDRVKNWFTHNEPWVAAFAGNLQGRHAPGNKDLKTAVAVSHHLLLSHAKAVEVYRKSPGGKDGKIGIVLNLYPAVPASDSAEDKKLAELCDAYQNRWFLDPLYKGAYPEPLRNIFEKAGAPVPEKDGDLAFISGQKTDFLGCNYYVRKVVRAATEAEKTEGKTPHAALPYVEIIPPGAQVTAMPWEVYPEALYDMLKRLDVDYGSPDILITENGAAFPDDKFATGTDYLVDDEDRRAFLEGHFAAALKAIKGGVKLRGFFVWSMMDNFEWARGYSKRFGIFHIDYATRKRSWKKSGRWYQSFVKKD